MSINDICHRLYGYKKQGRDIFDVTLQRTPLGFHSREVAEFTGRLVAARLATMDKNLTITQDGVKWLEEFVENN